MRRLALCLLALAGCAAEPGASKPDPEVPAERDPADFLAGRDYWPDDVRAHGFRVLTFGDGFFANAADVIVHDERVWVLLGGLQIAPLDMETGLVDMDEATVLVTPGQTEDAADRHNISNAAIRPCTPQTETDVPLAYDAASGLWRTPHLGIDPDTLVLNGDGACEPTLGPRGHVPGYLAVTGDRTYDMIDAVGCDQGVSASYAWTTCSLEGDAAWHCPLDADRDDDPGSQELGACSWFIVYEGNVVLAEAEGPMPRRYDLRLFLAHGASLRSRFRKYTADGTDNPTIADARIASTQPHALTDIVGSSWASVPSLYRDEAAGLWRVYFSAEVYEGSAQRYAESADDGLTWGIDGHYAGSVDCWDAAAGAFDEQACLAVEWAPEHTPPDDPETDRSPDVVDAQVIPWPGPESEDGGVMMLFSGADPRCEPEPRWSSYGAGWHPGHGDQSTGVLWEYQDAVAADPSAGALLSPDRSDPTCTDLLHDFTVTRVSDGRYLMLYQPVWRSGDRDQSDGVYLSASGYACSNFADDDGDGLSDYGVDPDCATPLDETE